MLDLFLGIAFCGVLPFILVAPSVGVLAWCVVAYAAPHHLTPGFAYNFPVAEVIGLATLVGWLLSREPKRLAITPTMVLLLAFALWMSVAAFLAIDPDFAKWRETAVKIAAAFLAFQIMRTPQRVYWLAWVSAMSIAFYGIKGGIVTIATLGAVQIGGPPESQIGDNNDLAVALVMVLPLLAHVRATAQSTVLKAGYAASIVLTSLSVLATYSRGGLLAIGSVGIYFWSKSRHKVIIAVLIALAATGALSFMPEKWYERMESIGNYNSDASVQGRFDAWNHALNIIEARPFIGAGFGAFSEVVFSEYSPGVKPRAGHSIYFECLGEQGLVGLALFLGIWLSAFRDARRTVRLARGREDLRNMTELARMLQISLIGYAVGGAFLSLTYFELFYGLVVLCAATRLVVEDKLSQPATAIHAQPPGPARIGSAPKVIGWAPRPALSQPRTSARVSRKGATP
jgi:putative inorganic carbon (hco3(-)) transporter